MGSGAGAEEAGGMSMLLTTTLLILLLALQEDITDAGCSQAEEEADGERFLHCWVEEADKEDDYCRGLDLGEVGCREKESCLSRGSRGAALMIRLRSNQAKQLKAMGWQCAKLQLWIWQDEVFSTLLSGLRERDPVLVVERMISHGEKLKN